ncbi:MAG TPA: hypothetical protein VFJ17_13700 [Mycobacteriales bacterium]|jgi:hypothetical protein|nr:hypothetical protein [Mycobacteriales bacterium]
MSYRYRRWWHGLEWPLGAAAVFFVFGVVMTVIVLTSDSGVQWTGKSVHGTSRGGIATYTYQGSEYQVSDDNHKSYVTPHPVTVWLSRSHPEDVARAFVANTAARWLDFAMVVVWYLVAAGFVVGGVVRHRRFL